MRFGLPRDPAQWIALALSAAALLAGARRWAVGGARRRPRETRALRRGARRWAVATFVAASAACAALLSAAYIAAYLRGGPRIIDATSYWLEARAIANGHLAWPLTEPATAVLGRFLVRGDSAAGPTASVIFPPGYPAVLALGFLAGAPLAVGPLLAAAIVVATYDLAARLDANDPAPAPSVAGIPFVPALATLLSVVCAALRYHTADTMSHGAAALCFTAALSLAMRALDGVASSEAARRAAPLGFAALSGVAAGWLAATRPPSALALAAALLVLLARDAPGDGRGRASARARVEIAAAIALGALPGLALFAAHQRAATGAWASSQAAYYAASDGPPGCFRYGFGDGIGCIGEHGDFVRHNLAHGYGAIAAAGTTLRRLKMHLVDPLNAEPLALVVVAGAAVAARRPRARLLALAPLLQIAAYAPFYFDGNYPGGGARFYADVLPIEHVLAAIAVGAAARRWGDADATRWLALAVGLPLAGFALRAGFDHALLRDRDGGVPMFDATELMRAGIARGLVFIDTDHGFNLGHQPGEPEQPNSEAPTHVEVLRTHVEVLRYHGDALDRMAWEARGRPPAYRYRFELASGDAPAVVSISPLSFGAPHAAPSLDEAVIEGESLWPPLAQHDAWALSEPAGGTCASASRWLAVHAAAGGAPSIRLPLPAPWLRGAELAPRVALSGGVSGALRLVVDGAEAFVWAIPPLPDGAAVTCSALAPHPVPAAAARVELTLERDAPVLHVTTPAPPVDGRASEGLLALDALSVRGGKSVDR